MNSIRRHPIPNYHQHLLVDSQSLPPPSSNDEQNLQQQQRGGGNNNHLNRQDNADYISFKELHDDGKWHSVRLLQFFLH